jgi:hypothetical protein
MQMREESMFFQKPFAIAHAAMMPLDEDAAAFGLNDARG